MLAQKLKWPRFAYKDIWCGIHKKNLRLLCWGRLGIELWRRTWRETKEAKNHNYFDWKFFSVWFDFCATITAVTCDWLLLFLNRITCESCLDLSWSGPRSSVSELAVSSSEINSARSANKLAQRRCLTGHQRFGEVRPDYLEKKMKMMLSIQIVKFVLFSYMYQINRFRIFVLQLSLAGVMTIERAFYAYLKLESNFKWLDWTLLLNVLQKNDPIGRCINYVWFRD